MLRTEDGEAIYRRCSDTHHHHLVCRSCGATVEVEGPAVERWTRAIAAEHGYADVSHTLEIFGTCRDCVPTARLRAERQPHPEHAAPADARSRPRSGHRGSRRWPW